jgi:hypothetical protein
MLMFMLLVIASVIVFSVMMMIATRRRYPRLVCALLVTAVNDPFVPGHQVQLHRGHHAWGARLANWASLRQLGRFHGPDSFERAAFITKIGIDGHDVSPLKSNGKESPAWRFLALLVNQVS